VVRMYASGLMHLAVVVLVECVVLENALSIVIAPLNALRRLTNRPYADAQLMRLCMHERCGSEARAVESIDTTRDLAARAQSDAVSKGCDRALWGLPHSSQSYASRLPEACPAHPGVFNGRGPAVAPCSARASAGSSVLCRAVIQHCDHAFYFSKPVFDVGHLLVIARVCAPEQRSEELPRDERLFERVQVPVMPHVSYPVLHGVQDALAQR
jgi:hypothetical protein